MVDEVARRYATLISENTRAKCAENVPLGALSINRKKEATQSILETPIELI